MAKSLKLEPANRGRTQVTLVDGGLPTSREASTFSSDAHFGKVAKSLGVSKQLLYESWGLYEAGGHEPLDVAIPEEAAKPFVVWARSTIGSGPPLRYEGSSPGDALAVALADDEVARLKFPALSWLERELLAALDVDLTEGLAEMDFSAMSALAVSIRPSPKAWWATHGGGGRFVYEASGGFPADELAGAAALWLAMREPRFKFEVKRDTRHPSYAREDGGKPAGAFRVMPTAVVEAGKLRLWGSSGDTPGAADEYDRWLGERGLERGKRYPHDRCPAQPHEDAGRAPVEVREDAVFCHRCAAKGVRLGSRTPGLFPLATLTGSEARGTLGSCVANLAHWEHARHVAVAVTPSLDEDTARLAYLAACRFAHFGDLRLPSVSTAGRDVIRLERRWATAAGETYVKDMDAVLARLPAFQVVTNGEVKPCSELLARASQPVDLAAMGYPALTPIWGGRLWSLFLPVMTPSATHVVLPTRDLATEQAAAVRPKLVDTTAKKEEAAWRTLETALPGLNRDLIRLLMVAKGVAESDPPMPPMLFLTGPTGSMKTTSVLIAAAICGDSNHSVVWTPNVERARQAILDAKDSGSFVTFNEVLKEGAKGGQTALETMDFLLNLSADSVSHKLYVGPVRMGSLPVCVWTDTELPQEVKQDAQLARRLVHVHLPSRVDWDDTVRSSGLGQIRWLRLASEEFAKACDVIYSACVRRFFMRPISFIEAANELGFSQLEKAAEATEARDLLLEFFATVARAPNAGGADAKRWKGRGWVVLSRDFETEACSLWRELCDGAEGAGFASSRRCAEQDWRRLLNAKGDAIQFECRAHGHSKVAVRFKEAGASRVEYKVNGELL